jgi:hypothetical protein
VVATHAFNIVKGRAIELVNRVKVGDPAAARLYVIPLSTSVAQATAEDVDDFAALITAGAVEQTAGGWSRITIAAADITALSPDDTNNRYDADFIDLVWAGPTAGNNVSGLVVCYASVATPTNAQLMPLSHHDFVITADGSSVTGTVAVFYRAS